jgi:hypothetical protein
MPPDEDGVKTQRVMKAMLSLKRIIIAALGRARADE